MGEMVNKELERFMRAKMESEENKGKNEREGDGNERRYRFSVFERLEM